MDIKYHAVIGYTFITAKIRINNEISYYVTKGHKDKRDALNNLFDLIKRDHFSIISPIQGKDLITA